MNSNKQDMQLREQIGKVSTLDGGIVYGKEEAWEKLQVRLDKKPARIILVRHWLAAAAMLLLFITAGIFYYQPKTNDVVKEIAPTTRPDNIGTQPLQTATTASSPATAETPVTISMSAAKAIHTRKPVLNMQPIPMHLLIRQGIALQAPAALLTLNAPAATQHRMRVLHINELDKADALQEDEKASEEEYNGPSLVNINKMRVLHINELIRQQSEDRFIPTENKPSFVNITFMKKSYVESYHLNNDQFSHSFLKISFSN